MINEMLREALQEMVRCAQKQNWRDNYPSAMEKAYAALDAAKEDAPPAAAHGDEAVLWELLEALRTATDRQALPGEFIRVMWEAGCDWINARAAMRAQGDGEDKS